MASKKPPLGIFLCEILRLVVKYIWKLIVNCTVHKDFHEAISKMTIMDRLLFLFVHYVDWLGIWHRMPVFLGLAYLAIRRHLHQQYNLLEVQSGTSVISNQANAPYRPSDGSYNDPSKNAGGYRSFFGRNMLPSEQQNELQKPHPMVVAAKLLARKEYKDTGKQFNTIAASWIQFMIHDWVDHLEDTNQIELTAPPEVDSRNKCPLHSFKFYKTKEEPTNFVEIENGHLNIRTSWWDASVIYGSNSEKLKKVRTGKDGKLQIAENGLLLLGTDGVAISGDVRNSWAGVSTLQALFIQEHNKVCDAIKKENPTFNDEQLYRFARLVISAVIAKIHTIDWTVELLKTDILHSGMRANWYGLLGKKFKDKFGHIGGPILGGLVGLRKPVNHGVPYSLTEEFVSVYRMHPLLPDDLQVRDIKAAPGPNKQPLPLEKIPMTKLIGLEGEKTLGQIGFETQLVSMGHQACGALELWNYPDWLRDLVPQDVNGRPRSERVDLAALEVYRDRERKVSRYNDFRRGLLLIPISKWEDLTDDKKTIEALKEVYGDKVDKLDLLVGLLAEKKIKGFAISETAFVIFLIMATRRLEADMFFTTYFNEKIYTKVGMDWVNSTESLKDVIDRHYPGMTSKWMNSESAFSVWDSPPKPNHSLLSIFLRLPKLTISCFNPFHLSKLIIRFLSPCGLCPKSKIF